MTPIADTIACLQFFSRLPLRATTQAPLARSVRCLPLAGAVLGGGQAVALTLCAGLAFPSPVAASIALLAGVALTGGLHEDGLADAADGFGGGGTRERKLAIMRDSRIGTFGVLAILFSLALRGEALATLLDRRGLAATAAALVAVAALSRALALMPMSALPPARDDGLGRGFGRPPGAVLLICGALAALFGLVLPLAAGFGLGRTALACTAAVAAAGLTTRLAARQIGGHTGDVAGAAQQVAETAYLLGLIALPGSF